MNAFQIFTVIGITTTLIIGLFNLWLNIKSQRKSHRELIFQRQFEFFIQLQNLIADLENIITDLNMEYTNSDKIIEEIIKNVEHIDIEISRNELIIPDVLYSQIYGFLKHCREISRFAISAPAKITEEYKDEFIVKLVDLNDIFREYIGIEKLSKENRDLVGNKL